MKEARIAGADFYGVYDMTWGEAGELIEAYTEREKRRTQVRSLIAYCQAGVLAREILGGDVGPVYDEMPGWTDGEKARIRVDLLQAKMDAAVARDANKS